MKKKPSCPHHSWFTNVNRSLLTAAAIISVSLLIGIVGYHCIGQLSWINALLEAAMILGGEGPIAPMSNDAVKLFASFYALYSGLILLTTTGVLLAPWLHQLVYHSHRQAHNDAKAADEK